MFTSEQLRESTAASPSPSPRRPSSEPALTSPRRATTRAASSTSMSSTGSTKCSASAAFASPASLRCARGRVAAATRWSRPRATSPCSSASGSTASSSPSPRRPARAATSLPAKPMPRRARSPTGSRRWPRSSDADGRHTPAGSTTIACRPKTYVAWSTGRRVPPSREPQHSRHRNTPVPQATTAAPATMAGSRRHKSRSCGRSLPNVAAIGPRTVRTCARSTASTSSTQIVAWRASSSEACSSASRRGNGAAARVA